MVGTAAPGGAAAGGLMAGAFSAHAFSPAAFLTQYMLRDRCGAGAPELPPAWLAFPLPAAGFICPQVAQLALMRGAAWSFAGGRVSIGGAVLVGQAGGVYEFVGIDTAANWVQLTRERGAAELGTLAGMGESEAAIWKAARRAALMAYAARVIDRAAAVADQAKQAAMVQESNFSALKWA